MGKKRLAQVLFIVVAVFFVMPVFAAQVQLAWDASSGQVDGYRIYYGTTQGNHPTKIEVGNVTNYTVTNLQEGVTYYFVARAYNQYGESGDSNEIIWTAPVNDTTLPTIQITSPTAGETYDTNNNTVTLSGTANDNIQVSQVTWVNSAGGSGTASGTTSWTIQNISLVAGENQITITAQDSSGNTATDTITVNYTVPQGTYTKAFGDSSDSDYTGTVQDTFLNINNEINVASTTLNSYTWPTDKPANAIVMKWDLSAIPDGAQIQSATLYLYMSEMEDGGGDSTYDVSVHKIINHNPDISQCNGYTYDGTHNWTANTVCYNNIPLAQADIALAEDTKSLDKTYGYKTWNVTQMARDWVTNPSSNYGLLLNSDSSASSGSNRFFASSEAADASQRPKLVITYTVGLQSPSNVMVVH